MSQNGQTHFKNLPANSARMKKIKKLANHRSNNSNNKILRSYNTPPYVLSHSLSVTNLRMVPESTEAAT